MAVIKSKDFPQIMLSELNGLWRGSCISCSRKPCCVSIPSSSLKLSRTVKGLQFSLFVRKQVSLPQYHRHWQKIWDSWARDKEQFINHSNSSSQSNNICAGSRSPDSCRAKQQWPADACRLSELGSLRGALFSKLWSFPPPSPLGTHLPEAQGEPCWGRFLALVSHLPMSHGVEWPNPLSSRPHPRASLHPILNLFWKCC